MTAESRLEIEKLPDFVSSHVLHTEYTPERNGFKGVVEIVDLPADFTTSLGVP
jgi:hypothetical protein